jgi:MFS family permease
MTFVGYGADEKTPPPPGSPAPQVVLRYYNVVDVNRERELIQGAKPPLARAPRWQLLSPFGYLASGNRYFGVPAHTGNVADVENSTDLASVPPALWGLLAPYGPQLRPALLHDRRCVLADQAGRSTNPAVRELAREIRKEGDYLFRESLAAESVGLWRCWLFWTGVSFGRLLKYSRVLAGLLAILVLGMAWVGFHAAAVAANVSGLGVHRWLGSWGFWVALVAVAGVCALLRWFSYAGLVPLSMILIASWFAGAHGTTGTGWRNLAYHGYVALGLLVLVLAVGLATDWRVAVIATAVGPIVLAVLLCTTLSEFLLVLPDRIMWRLTNSGGLGPIPTPTSVRWNRMQSD